MPEHEELIQEATIQDILMRAKYLYGNPEGQEIYPAKGYIMLEYGSKMLDVVYHSGSDWIEVGTYIKQTNPPKGKIEGETSFLYQAAKRMMQKLVSELKKSLEYNLITPDTKMIQWAQTKGRQIFDWEKEIILEDGATQFTVYINLV